MAEYQVSCITKVHRDNPFEGIQYVGGPAGSGWKRSVAQVVALINNGDKFYTSVKGDVAWIGVVRGPNGDYLRTYADGKWNDNLLSLPDCPAAYGG